MCIESERNLKEKKGKLDTDAVALYWCAYAGLMCDKIGQRLYYI